MPPLARPARALPVRRTIGGQSLPEAHRKRAEIGAAEDELRRVRQIERTPGDERTTVDHRHGHAVRAVGERHQRPAGQRAVRDAEDRLRIGLPAGGPVAVEAGPIPAGDHDPAGRRWLERRKHDGPRAIPWKLSTSNADATVTGRGAVSWLGPTKGTANANANAAMPARTSGSRTTGRDRVQDRFHRVSIS